jgi:transposase-like protein
MAHLEVEIEDKRIVVRSQAFCCEFSDVGKNKKAILVWLRSLCSPETGNPLFTYQQLADAFDYGARQNVENFVAEFHASGDDFKAFLSRVTSKHDRLFPLVEAQILSSPYLSLHQHYGVFGEEHPEERLSESTFRSYVKAIDGGKILKRVRQRLSKKDATLDVTRYLQELLELEELPRAKKKELVACFPEVHTSSRLSTWKNSGALSGADMPRNLLVVLLYVCNVSQEMLSFLFGVGKTSIHKSIYAVCCGELAWWILGEIVRWSGQVSFDEKWVKIKGTWYFVLCAVDAVSGFPLLMDLYPTLDMVSWTLFFRRFKALYGLPKLIQCDGAQALAAAREVVFVRVRYQLCKFHKLRNLMKRLRQLTRDPKVRKRCLRLAKHIFSNPSVSSRKYAAKTLQQLAGQEVCSYIDAHILTCWRKLTLSLTTNVSERFNRKIEKCFSGRYGLPSEESAKVLLRGLWLKELLLNGQQHLKATSEVRGINLSRICQEHLDPGNILHFFHEGDLSQVEKLA